MNMTTPFTQGPTERRGHMIYTEETEPGKARLIGNADQPNDADLWSAATNSATECAKLGFDGMGCVKELPQILDTLKMMYAEGMASKVDRIRLSEIATSILTQLKSK